MKTYVDEQLESVLLVVHVMETIEPEPGEGPRFDANPPVNNACNRGRRVGRRTSNLRRSSRNHSSCGHEASAGNFLINKSDPQSSNCERRHEDREQSRDNNDLALSCEYREEQEPKETEKRSSTRIQTLQTPVRTKLRSWEKKVIHVR